MHVAVLLSALLAFLLGWLWYSDKVFGPAWEEATGRKRVDEQGEGLAQLAVNILGWIVAAFAYALFASNAVFTGLQDYMYLSIILWGAFFLPPKAMAIVNGGFSTKLIWIDGLYFLFSYLIFAFVFTLFV